MYFFCKYDILRTICSRASTSKENEFVRSRTHEIIGLRSINLPTLHHSSLVRPKQSPKTNSLPPSLFLFFRSKPHEEGGMVEIFPIKQTALRTKVSHTYHLEEIRRVIPYIIEIEVVCLFVMFKHISLVTFTDGYPRVA